MRCMRTNLHLDEGLLDEAMRLSGARTKRAVIEEALRAYVAQRKSEERRASYRDRLTNLEARTAGILLTDSSVEILRADRDR